MHRCLTCYSANDIATDAVNCWHNVTLMITMESKWMKNARVCCRLIPEFDQLLVPFRPNVISTNWSVLHLLRRPISRLGRAHFYGSKQVWDENKLHRDAWWVRPRPRERPRMETLLNVDAPCSHEMEVGSAESSIFVRIGLSSAELQVSWLTWWNVFVREDLNPSTASFKSNHLLMHGP